MRLIDEMDNLRGAATNIAKALEDETDGNPQSGILVLAMVAAFIINTQRTEHTPMEKARKIFISILTAVTDAGEKGAQNEAMQ